MQHLAEFATQGQLDSIPMFINLPLVSDESIDRAEQQEQGA